MPRKATGKPLTLFPIRVDEDVKAALLAFKAKGTINEGLRSALLNDAKYTPAIEKKIKANLDAVGPPVSGGRGKATTAAFQRPCPLKFRTALFNRNGPLKFKGALLKPKERK